MVCANRIPHSRGLGSSAAAIVAGLAAARALVLGGADTLDDDALLALAAELEGHPDNVAACLLGGLTLAWTPADGPAHAVRLPVSPALRPVVFVPTTSASTAKARKLLPETVPHADAARNAGRSALLVHALAADPGLLLAATEDRLHQQYRAPSQVKTRRRWSTRCGPTACRRWSPAPARRCWPSPARPTTSARTRRAAGRWRCSPSTRAGRSCSRWPGEVGGGEHAGGRCCCPCGGTPLGFASPAARGCALGGVSGSSH